MKLKVSRLVLILAAALVWLLLMLVATLLLFYRRQPPSTIYVFGIIVEVILLLLLFRNLLVSGRPHPSIRRYYIISLDVAEIKVKADSEQPFSLELGKQRVEVIVGPNKIFDDQCETIELVGNEQRRNRVEETITYSGKAIGAEDTSEVRLTITEDMLTGYVLLREDWWFIEPFRKFHLAANLSDYIVYRTKDLRFRLPYGDDVRPKKVEHQDDRGANPPHRVNPVVGITVLADREYNTASSITSNWWQAQSSLINNINGIYQSRLGCELRVRSFIRDLRVNSLNTTTADQLLTQMENPINLVLGDLHQLSVRQSTGVEVAHLTTGKDLDGKTLGVAWQPGVYSLSQQSAYTTAIEDLGLGIDLGLGNTGSDLSFRNMMVAAHEIAHNFNGEHNEADEWCVTHIIWCWDSARTIMWPTFYQDNEPFFSDGSRNAGHNNRKRIKDNMATGRNHNF